MGKNVLIIGASGDIGVVIARQLANEGYQLLLHYHSNHFALKKLWDEVKEEQLLQMIQADLSSKEGMDQLIAAIAFRVDAIIFANGKASVGLFQDVKDEEIDEMLMLHVKSPLMITNKLLPDMIRKQTGKIIFITSIWGEIGASNEVLYSTLKGAQNSFVQSLAKEVAGSGVSVHAISPGFIDTKMNANLSAEERSTIFDAIPLKRPGTPLEVADAVVYLLAERTNYLNGQIIQVSGGWMI